MATRGSRAAIAIVVLLGVLLAVAAHQRFVAPSASPPSAGAPAGRAETSGDRTIEEAFHSHRSGVWVESSGIVQRVLDDDRSGSRHQRFIVRLRDGLTLLFAHNIDLAERVPVESGTTIRFRGMYEWNERGGTVHWTHRSRD